MVLATEADKIRCKACVVSAPQVNLSYNWIDSMNNTYVPRRILTTLHMDLMRGQTGGCLSGFFRSGHKQCVTFQMLSLEEPGPR